MEAKRNIPNLLDEVISGGMSYPGFSYFTNISMEIESLIMRD